MIGWLRWPPGGPMRPDEKWALSIRAICCAHFNPARERTVRLGRTTRLHGRLSLWLVIVFMVVTIGLLLPQGTAWALTYVAGLETGGMPDFINGGFGPPVSYGAMANIATPGSPITRHPATIKAVVGGRYSAVWGQHQHRAGWILRIGETQPRHYIEGYDANGLWYQAFPIVNGSNTIGWGVSTPARVEYWQFGWYKMLINNTWWTTSYTTYPDNSGFPLPHFGVGLASNTGNDLRGSFRGLKRQIERWDPVSLWFEFRNWDTIVQTDYSKYWITIFPHGLGNSYWDNFDLHSAY